MWSGSVCPVAWCRDGMGSLVAVPGGHSDPSALLSISSAGSVCAGPGAPGTGQPSLMATAHFHIDRGISVSVCRLFATVRRLKTQISSFNPSQMLCGLGDCGAFGGATARPRGQLGAGTRVLRSSAGPHGISTAENAVLPFACSAALAASRPAREQRRPRGGRGGRDSERGTVNITH